MKNRPTPAGTPIPDAEAILLGLKQGDRRMLARAITLVESSRPEHQELARSVLDGCLHTQRSAMRVALTGSPGAGKSTFIEALGLFLIEQGKRVAVLAVDPSSRQTRGSILGDKARMERLSVRPEAFIRPTPSSGHLGGSAPRTHEAILLSEAAGFDVILVETVGVGQSEVLVDTMVDFVLLLMLPGSGDDLQGIKRGIMEIADAVAVSKCDGTLESAARTSQADFEAALRMLPRRHPAVERKVLLTSSVTGKGVQEVWEEIEGFFSIAKASGALETKRRTQRSQHLQALIEEGLLREFFSRPTLADLRGEIDRAVQEGRTSPFSGAGELVTAFLQSLTPPR